MTQMGLDYMRHKETQRHNISDEGIRNRQTDISGKEADTRAYIASFKPQEVAITKQQADASSSQARTAQGRLDMDEKYRDRETATKELTSAAAWEQAHTAHARYALDKDYREREMLAKEIQAAAASSQALTAEERQLVDEFTGLIHYLDPATAAKLTMERLGQNTKVQNLAGFTRLLDRIFPKLNLSAK